MRSPLHENIYDDSLDDAFAEGACPHRDGTNEVTVNLPPDAVLHAKSDPTRYFEVGIYEIDEHQKDPFAETNTLKRGREVVRVPISTDDILVRKKGNSYSIDHILMLLDLHTLLYFRLLNLLER